MANRVSPRSVRCRVTQIVLRRVRRLGGVSVNAVTSLYSISGSAISGFIGRLKFRSCGRFGTRTCDEKGERICVGSLGAVGVASCVLRGKARRCLSILFSSVHCLFFGASSGGVRRLIALVRSCRRMTTFKRKCSRATTLGFRRGVSFCRGFVCAAAGSEGRMTCVDRTGRGALLLVFSGSKECVDRCARLASIPSGGYFRRAGTGMILFASGERVRGSPQISLYVS